MAAGLACRLSQINIGELQFKVTVCFMDCSGIEFDPQLYEELLQGQGRAAQRAYSVPFYTGLEVHFQ